MFRGTYRPDTFFHSIRLWQKLNDRFNISGVDPTSGFRAISSSTINSRTQESIYSAGYASSLLNTIRDIRTILTWTRRNRAHS
jgi:hypothetical protein